MSFTLPNKVGAFRVEGINPEWNDPKWMIVPNHDAKELRWWQPDAFDKGKFSRFFLAVAFCGSGKSILQVALGVHDVVASGYKQKQLIVVPQSHISRGFIGDEDLDYIPIMVEGKKYEWKVQFEQNFCDQNSQEVLKNLKEWLLKSGTQLSKKFNGNVISGLIAVASHQAVGLVWGQLTEKERKQAIKHLTFRPDEAHHIKGVFDVEEEGLTDQEKLAIEMESTNLGDICRFIINSDDKTSKIHAATATPYRGDKRIILSSAVQKMFDVYYLDWIDHWKTLGIKDFVVEYEEYDGDPIEKVVARIKSEPKEKHMIVIPSTTHKWRVDGKNEFARLMKRLNEELPKHRILDLVTKETQAKNKQLLLQEPKRADKGESKFDIVVSCMLGREGTDWCPCSRLHNTACENSVTMAIQTIGRPFRRFGGKTTVRIYYYVSRFVMPEKGMTKRELLSDRTNALLLLMQLDEMSHPILVPVIPNGVEDDDSDHDGEDKSKRKTLMEIFGDQYQSMKQELFEEVEALENKTSEDIKFIIDRILDEHDIDDNRAGVKEALIVLALRALSPPLRSLGIDVTFLRENGFDRIIEKYKLEKSSIYFGGDFGSEEWNVIRQIYRDQVAENKKELIALAEAGSSKPHYTTRLGRVLGSYVYDCFKTFDANFANKLKRLAPEWFVNTANTKKAELINLAIAKAAKPHHLSPLGKALGTYINKTSGSYDLEFATNIQQYAPHWFVDTTIEKKQLLLAKARNGEKRPAGTTAIGSALHCYTCKSQASYSQTFDDEIRSLRPDWFINSADERKRELLQCAKDGKPRPVGGKLSSYTSSSNPCYDEQFDAEIRGIRPDWFVDTTTENMNAILKLARDGEPRPTKRGGHKKLGVALSIYTNPNNVMFKAEFDKQIRELAPQWFVDQAAEKKSELIEMAKRQEEKPHYSTELGSRLPYYTKVGHKCFDAEFDATIRRLAPQWFVDPAAERKQQLLELAKKGTKKSELEYLLKHSLSVYANKNHKCFDPVFDEQIRKAAPQWFNVKLQTAVKKAHDIFKRAKANGKMPSQHSSNPQERSDGQWICNRRGAKRSSGIAMTWYPELDIIAAKFGFPNAFDTAPRTKESSMFQKEAA